MVVKFQVLPPRPFLQWRIHCKSMASALAAVSESENQKSGSIIFPGLGTAKFNSPQNLTAIWYITSDHKCDRAKGHVHTH